jgi:signal transduction histidine kinase
MKIRSFSLYFTFLICLLTGSPGAKGSNLPGQPLADSLINAVKKAKTPKDKISPLFELGKAYYNESEIDKALENNKELIEIISKHGSKNDSARYFRLMGLIYLKMGWQAKSLENFMQSQQLFAADGDTLLQARALMNVGIVHDKLGNKPMSLSYYKKAMVLFDSINDDGGMADCELNMAILLTKQKEYERACESFISAAGIYERIGNTANLASAYINLGLTCKKMGNYPLAIDYLGRANEIWEKIGDQYHTCYYHLNMSAILIESKKPEQAYDHLIKAEALAKKSDGKDLEALSYEFMSDYYAAVKNHESAYKYLLKSKQINDSLLNVETTEKVNQILYQYEIAKRETENEKLVKQNLNKELQLSKKNMFLYILSAILVFIAVFTTLLVRQNHIRNKINRQLAIQNNLIEKQKDELIKLNASKDKFLSILAHDIRNPLSSIYGISEILTNDYETLSADERKIFTKDIHTLSENLFEIINTLLKWSTSQSGLIAHQPADFALASLCNKSMLTLQTVAKQKDITLICNADVTIHVHADENMIYSVFHNLITNAIKFSYKGASISIETTRNNGFAEIAVIDTGMGLTAETKESLFRYDQHLLRKGTAGESGTGLGLILCKDFVEKNGGTIRVESEPGKGSTFVFSIPLVKTLTSDTEKC